MQSFQLFNSHYILICYNQQIHIHFILEKNHSTFFTTRNFHVCFSSFINKNTALYAFEFKTLLFKLARSFSNADLTSTHLAPYKLPRVDKGKKRFKKKLRKIHVYVVDLNVLFAVVHIHTPL